MSAYLLHHVMMMMVTMTTKRSCSVPRCSYQLVALQSTCSISNLSPGSVTVTASCSGCGRESRGGEARVRRATGKRMMRLAPGCLRPPASVQSELHGLHCGTGLRLRPASASSVYHAVFTHRPLHVCQIATAQMKPVLPIFTTGFR